MFQLGHMAPRGGLKIATYATLLHNLYINISIKVCNIDNHQVPCICNNTTKKVIIGDLGFWRIHQYNYIDLYINESSPVVHILSHICFLPASSQPDKHIIKELHDILSWEYFMVAKSHCNMTCKLVILLKNRKAPFGKKDHFWQIHPKHK